MPAVLFQTRTQLVLFDSSNIRYCLSSVILINKKENHMKYWLDTEFIEYPCTIDLVSIGIVSEDGRQFYRVSNEYDVTKASDWVRKNVLNILPKCERDIQSLKQIRDGIKEFVGDDIGPEFWGYYADYDWVVFCWIFGTMMDLPAGWPMYCRDIKQWCDQLGNPDLPEQGEGEHDALEDARWNKKAWKFLDNIEKEEMQILKLIVDKNRDKKGAP